jgi:hypothetical protein
MMGTSKVKKVKKSSKSAKNEADDSDTDSDCDLDLEPQDEISTQTQDEISKYLTRNHLNSKVKSINPTLRDFLAAQRLKEIFKVTKTDLDDLKVKARAALVPLDLKNRCPAPISYRSFKIGLGSQVDLDLGKYGKCANVSDHHAEIFFDQYTRSYEVINYSEHGLVVDNVIYSGDTSGHPTRIISGKNIKRMAAEAKTGEKLCFCTKSAAQVNYEKGCETSAVLHHGSYLRIGCLQFVFCILTYGDFEEKSHNLETAEAENKNEENLTEEETVETPMMEK